MTVRAWRIVNLKHSASAFSGEGAYINGGRWNSPGVRVVYASLTKSLAALETLIHLNPAQPLKYVSFRVDFDETLVEKILLSSLPPNGATNLRLVPRNSLVIFGCVKRVHRCWSCQA